MIAHRKMYRSRYLTPTVSWLPSIPLWASKKVFSISFPNRSKRIDNYIVAAQIECATGDVQAGLELLVQLAVRPSFPTFPTPGDTDRCPRSPGYGVRGARWRSPGR